MKEEPKNRMLAEIVTDPARIADVSPEIIAGLRGELAAIDTLLLGRLLSPIRSAERRSQPDRRLNVKEAAAKLGMSRDWLYRHAAAQPFTVKIGRSVGFSEEGIERWLRQRAGR